MSLEGDSFSVCIVFVVGDVVVLEVLLGLLIVLYLANVDCDREKN